MSQYPQVLHLWTQPRTQPTDQKYSESIQLLHLGLQWLLLYSSNLHSISIYIAQETVHCKYCTSCTILYKGWEHPWNLVGIHRQGWWWGLCVLDPSPTDTKRQL